MMLQESHFRYGQSHKMVTWGSSFDSLTELKFAVSVMEEYEWIRSPVSIYFHPGNLLPVGRVRRFHRRYTPDFLIRHRENGEAFLVEIKPRAFENHPQLLLRKEVAENYIRRKNYDWKYKVVFDDQIILNQDQWEEFRECSKLRSRSARSRWFEEYNKKFSRLAPTFFSSASANTKIEFLMLGTVRSTR